MLVLDKKWLQDDEYYLKGNIADAVTLDRLYGNYQVTTAVGNFGGWTINNLPNGDSIKIIIVGGGDWTPDWSGLTVCGTMPTLQTGSGRDLFKIWRAGSNYYILHVSATTPAWAPGASCFAWYYGDMVESNAWVDRIGDHNITLYSGAYASPTLGLVCADGSDGGWQTANKWGLSIDGAAGYTIAYWIKAITTAAAGQYHICFTTDNARYPYCWQYQTSGSLILQTAAYPGGPLRSLVASNCVDNDVWTHVAWVCDFANDDCIVYKNGNTTPFAANYNMSWGAAQVTWAPSATVHDAIGINNATLHTGIYGSIDDVQLYNTALSADDIADIVASSIASHA